MVGEMIPVWLAIAVESGSKMKSCFINTAASLGLRPKQTKVKIVQWFNAFQYLLLRNPARSLPKSSP